MARPKGSKNKAAEQKIEEAMEILAAEGETPEEMKEEIVEIMAEIEVKEVEPKGETYVGVHPVTGERMYV